jgi:predicted RNA binding protein YcfA (HicA-like mRNA interferase family)
LYEEQEPRHKGRRSLSDLNTAKVIKAFQRAGWQLAPKRGGRHNVMVKAYARAILVIPRHRRLKQGLMRKLIRDAGLTPEAFLDLY